MNNKILKVINVLKQDTSFVHRLHVATFATVALGSCGGYYALDTRLSALEKLRGEVEVTLGPREDNQTLTKSDKREFVAQSSRLYNNHHKILLTQEDIECLAKNIYYEAKFEPYIGKIAVAQVTFNRVLDGRWGDTICKVVYAHKQFSWTLKSRLRNRTPRGERWDNVLHVARLFQHGVRVRGFENVKWYHAEYVSPQWRHDYNKVNKYGLHIFYREKSGSKRYNEQQLIADSGQ